MFAITLIMSDVHRPTGKSDFAKLCRENRMRTRFKQREIAEKIGIKTSTYGNVESSPFRIIREDRADALGALFGLSEADHNRFMAAFRKLPLSEYGEKQRDVWKRKNAQRNRAKLCLRVQIALVEVLSMLLASVPDPGSLCSCSFERADTCEICAALEVLGLPPYTTVERAAAQLERLATKLTAERMAERAASENGAVTP